MQFGDAAEADPLAEFRHRNSKEGLLLRYARGRVKNFGSRQIMTLAAGVPLDHDGR